MRKKMSWAGGSAIAFIAMGMLPGGASAQEAAPLPSQDAQVEACKTDPNNPACPRLEEAQSPPEAATVSDEQQSGEAIVVTGTRIRRPNLTSNSPLTSVDAAEIRYQGAVGVENVLNRLPQVTPDSNENGSNGSDGTARVNLRNLGSTRNLVLVNGQRLLPVQANDLNFLPSFLVQRVDVVTGGASAVYGSDAISGVVNFILRDNLNGIRADVQYGLAVHENNNEFIRGIQRQAGFRLSNRNVADGQKLDANIAFGAEMGDGRGNVTAYFGYRDYKPITQGTRDVSSCALNAAGDRGSTVSCGGSSNNEFGLFNPQTGPGRGLLLNNTKDGNKTWVPYGPTFLYNYAPLNYFQRSDVRYTAGAFAKYEVTDYAEVYGSAMFMDDHTFSQVAPSALFQGFTYRVNCDNPLLSAQQYGLLCGAAPGSTATQDLFVGYRPVAGNARPRRDDLRHTDYRFTGGVRGEIAEGLRYDVNALHSVVLFNETYQNDIDPARANRGLQVVNVNGVPTCKSVIDGTDPNCVPLDVFRYNGISDAAFSYIYAPTSTEGVDKETVLNANISADLGTYGIRSPWSSQGVGFVLGIEHRRESLRFTADALAQQKGTLNSQGAFNVTELFTEIEVPILSDVPFAKELVINGGYRLSNYSNLSKAVSTYKGEVSWAPISDIRLRGSYNRAIRAPNISELFGPQIRGNVIAQDGCAGATPTASRDVCRLTGLPDALYGQVSECPTDFCTGLSGGNLALKPETADTYTAGVVLNPGFLKRLTLTVDYFNIKVRDYIGIVAPALTTEQCFENANPFFCALITRDPRNGVIFGDVGAIASNTQNTGSLATSGIDIGFSFAQPLGSLGALNLDAQGTWLNELRTEPLPGLESYDCKGKNGQTCGQPTPEWKHQARLTWSDAEQVGSISLNWRYIGGTTLDSTEPVFNSRIKAYSYFDLAATAKVQDGIVFRAGVNNLFDKDPPILALSALGGFNNGNTYPGVYDAVGRTVFVGLTAEF